MNLFSLFLFFLKISTITIGGGYAMVAVIQSEIKKFNIIDDKDFFEILTLSQTLPGPIIFNFAFLFGKKVSGWKGAFVSILGVLIPPFFSIVAISYFVVKFSSNKIVSSILKGSYASSMGLLLGMIFKNLKYLKFDILLICLLIISFLLNFLLNINILIILPFLVIIYYIYTKYRVDKEGKK